jgi:electron transfer flavoprotein alpha subunit
MAILLIAEHDNAALSDADRQGADRRRPDRRRRACAGAGKAAKATPTEAAKLDGVPRCFMPKMRRYGTALAEPMADLIVSLAGGYDAIVAPATTIGKNIMPRVAALLDVMQISDIIEVKSPTRSSVRSMPATPSRRSIDRRQEGHHRAAPPPSMRRRRRFGFGRDRALPAIRACQSFVKRKLPSDRPELTSAKIIISGGRALGSKEKFQEVILPVADKLGAAVGASRAAVDAGYAPNDWQVGQTGKVVAPDLYIACGISGAIQHLAGMKDSKVIVAINKDEEAPIFQVADYGLVADLFDAAGT